jgi:hypothetical protein
MGVLDKEKIVAKLKEVGMASWKDSSECGVMSSELEEMNWPKKQNPCLPAGRDWRLKKANKN